MKYQLGWPLAVAWTKASMNSCLSGPSWTSRTSSVMATSMALAPALLAVMRKLSGRLAGALEGGLLRVEFNGSVGQMHAEPAICRGGDGNHYTLAD